MPDTRAQLARLGLTDAEIEAWLALERAGARIAALPLLHPMVEHESAHALHRTEDLLLSRPGMRAQGWGSAPSEMPDVDERHARLERFGMTGDELDFWYAIAELAGRMPELAEKPAAATSATSSCTRCTACRTGCSLGPAGVRPAADQVVTCAPIDPPTHDMLAGRIRPDAVICCLAPSTPSTTGPEGSMTAWPWVS